MSNPLLLKNFIAGAAIAPFRIIKFSGAGTCIQSAAATDLSIGLSNEVGPAIGERFDGVLTGIGYLEAGAAFALGAEITSDSVGRGVTAAPAAGVNNRIVAIALEAAVALGDIVPVLLAQGVKQG
jgi:hypothetical protein